MRDSFLRNNAKENSRIIQDCCDKWDFNLGTFLIIVISIITVIPLPFLLITALLNDD